MSGALLGDGVGLGADAFDCWLRVEISECDREVTKGRRTRMIEPRMIWSCGKVDVPD